MIKLVFHKNKKLSPPSKDPITKIDKALLSKNNVVKSRCNESLHLKFSPDQSTTELNNNLINSIKYTAIENIPEKIKTKRKLPWSNDKQLLEYINEKKKSENQFKIKTLAKQIKDRLRFLENQYYLNKCKSLSILRETREVEKDFKKAKEIATGSVFKTIHSNVCLSSPKSHTTFHRSFQF